MTDNKFKCFKCRRVATRVVLVDEKDTESGYQCTKCGTKYIVYNDGAILSWTPAPTKESK
jgi:transcription elongation factor Elf1